MMSTGATCMLRLVRGSGYADRLRRYEIFINGAQVGTIARDAVLEPPLASLVDVLLGVRRWSLVSTSLSRAQPVTE